MPQFWRGVLHFERNKVIPWVAFRNAIGVALPLAIGAALGHATSGLIGTLGALNVAFSDGTDPYLHRLRRMLGATFCVGLAVFAGGLCGHVPGLAVLTVALCGLIAGMMVAIGPAITDIANVTLVTLIVFSAQSMAVPQAALSALASIGGGLLQTALSLGSWPFHPYRPERRALAALYSELGRSATASPNVLEAPAGSVQTTQASAALAALGRDSSLEAERHIALFSQGERIRLTLLTLTRLRVRIGREEHSEAEAAILDGALATAGDVLAGIAAALRTDGAAPPPPPPLPSRGLRPDARHQLDALAGQLRAATELASHTTPAGSTLFERREAAQPWTLRLGGAVAVLHANCNLQSAAFRHALRLSTCAALSEFLAHTVPWPRGYWIPMTAVIVLRPDFTTTFNRGILRVAGTLVGLGIATGLFHLLPAVPALLVLLIVVFAFLLRCFGPANYGIFAINLSALVVLMLAVTGVAPGPVIAARALSTFVGGAIALLAYQLWPTWERTQAPEAVASMFDAYRAYFHAVAQAYLHPDESRAAALDRARQDARLARSNAEASAVRLAIEPGVPAARLATLHRILANSHRFIHAVMSLEGGLQRSSPVAARNAFRPFSDHVEFTLYYLAATLRGTPIAATDFPDLREDHNILVQSGDPQVDRYALVNVEADRIVNSLNTIVEEVFVAAWASVGQNPVTRHSDC
jgi:uncharacterized membrane protein YccC